MITRLVFSTSILLVVTFGLQGRLSSLPAAASNPQNPSAQATGQQQPPQPNMQEMMKRHEQMMAEMKAADAKLNALVKDMNAATGDARIDAIAAVVNELVRQHTAMHDRMGQMHQHMMGGRGMMMHR